MSFPNTQHWQPALSGDGYVTDLDDIRQCVHIILETPEGSEPSRPDFGSKLYLLVDTPIHQAKPHLVRYTVEAIRKWEPRAQPKNVLVFLDSMAHMVVKPFLELADGVVISMEVRPWLSLK